MENVYSHRGEQPVCPELPKRYIDELYRELLDHRRRSLEFIAESERRLVTSTDSEERKVLMTGMKEMKKTISVLDERVARFHNVREISRVETKEAEFVLVYERHDREHSPRVLEELDGYTFEKVTVSFPEGFPGKPDFTFPERVTSGYLGEMNRPVIDVMWDKKLPVYICDVSDPAVIKAVLADEAVSDVVSMGVTIYGVKLLKDAFTKEKKGMSRRAFLQKAGGFLGAGLVLPKSLQYLDYFFSDHSDFLDDSVQSKLRRLCEDLWRSFGLYSLLVDFRNIIMAQKLHTISKDVISDCSLTRKPRVGMELGAAHYGIEEYLRIPEEARMGKMREALRFFKIPVSAQDLARIDIYRPSQDGYIWERDCIMDQGILTV